VTKSDPVEQRNEQGPDRLKAALGQMSGPFSTAMAARAAGLNNDKVTARLQDLERRGEIRRIGNRWSTESPPSEVDAAIDRLEARTSNLRIVRDRARAR
jgi:Fic family protein